MQAPWREAYSGVDMESNQTRERDSAVLLQISKRWDIGLS